MVCNQSSASRATTDETARSAQARNFRSSCSAVGGASDQGQVFGGKGTGLTNARRFWMALVIVGILALSILVAVALIYFREHMLRMGNWGYLGVFAAEMGNSAAIIIPTPGPVVTLAMASILNPVLVGLIGGVAASVGELFGYVVGASGRRALEGSRIHDRLQALPQHRIGPTLFLLAALPMPFDVAGIWAGAIHYSPRRFMLYVTAGKIIKVTSVAFVGYYGIGWLLRSLG